jgi:hypothetical protein
MSRHWNALVESPGCKPDLKASSSPSPAHVKPATQASDAAKERPTNHLDFIWLTSL